MKMDRGYSLIEVLVSLLLITSVSLVLLKQQWQISQLFNHAQKRSETLANLDSQRERYWLKQRGFSLIELFIGLFLISCIMLVLTQQYSQVKQNYLRTQTTIEETTELQLISDWMRMSIYKAGFTPCLFLDHLKVSDRIHLPSLSINPSLQIKRMSDDFVEISAVRNSHEIMIPQNTFLLENATVLIADCYHAEVQEIESRHGPVVKLRNALTFTYYPPIYIGAWIDETYFIKHEKLYYKLGHTEELTSAIHEMTLKLQHSNEHTLLQVGLILKNKQGFQFDAVVRSS